MGKQIRFPGVVFALCVDVPSFAQIRWLSHDENMLVVTQGIDYRGQAVTTKPTKQDLTGLQAQAKTMRCDAILVSVKKNSSGEEDMWGNQFSKHQIRGRIKVSATGLQLSCRSNWSYRDPPGGTNRAPSANTPLLRLQSSEGKFTTSREVEPARRSFYRHGSRKLTEVARLVPSGYR